MSELWLISTSLIIGSKLLITCQYYRSKELIFDRLCGFREQGTRIWSFRVIRFLWTKNFLSEMIKLWLNKTVINSDLTGNSCESLRERMLDLQVNVLYWQNTQLSKYNLHSSAFLQYSIRTMWVARITAPSVWILWQTLAQSTPKPY